MAAGAQRDRQFKVLKFVGKGSYGSVFLVQRLADSQTYALKEMDVRSMSQAEREDSINEIRLLASVSHPNVVSYNEAFLDGNRLCIIMEYAADGDLAKVIKKQQMAKRPLPEDVIWRYFIQVVSGLQALHAMKILHRDMKPGNIMVFEGGVVKIGDLGIAKLLTKTAAAKTQIGTPHYMGPEIWKNRPYSYTSDTWAVGCLLYELAALAVPFEARSMSELRYKVLRGSYPPIPNTFSRDLQQIIRECLDPNPDKRPSMDALLSHPSVVSRAKLVPQECRNPPPTAGSALVETIKVPRGNIAAIKNKLPPAQYATDMLNMGMGGGHRHSQMSTIDEGSEEDLPPSRPGANRPAMAPLPPMPKPNYPAAGLPPKPSYSPAPLPPLPPAPMARAPHLPAIGAPPQSSISEGGGPAGGGYGIGRSPASRPPPPSYLPSAPVSNVPSAPPSSHGGASAWSYGGAPSIAGAGGGVQHNKVSESHANYGAFYHQNVYAPGGALPARQELPPPVASAWQQQAAANNNNNKWVPPVPLPTPPQQPQAPSYQSPYISPYGQAQRAYGVAAAGGGAVPHLPQLNAPRPMQQVRQPPPWNYGAQAAPRRAPRASAAGGGVARPPGGGYYGGGEGGQQQQQQQQAELPRYPPPQWAPRPARW